MKFTHLLEAKQVGLMYHQTAWEELVDILQSNTLKSQQPPNLLSRKLGEPTISFTRFKSGVIAKLPTSRLKNKYMPNFYGGFTIMVDGNKLSNNYKIRPVDFANIADINPPNVDNMENVVLAKQIKNFSKYIKKIVMSKKPHTFDRWAIQYMELAKQYPNIKFE